MNINGNKNYDNEDYRREAMALGELYSVKCNEVLAKYPDYKGSGGHDGAPYNRELKQLRNWVAKELEKIKNKYGLPLRKQE